VRIRFPYKKVAPATKRRPATIRPLIEIELAAKNKERVRTEALIDSGADMSMFSWELADILGLKKKDALRSDTFSGVLGKPAPYYAFEIFLILGGEHKVIATCGFTEHLPSEAHGFLGQIGFFSEYRIEFIHKKGIIRIGDKTK